MSWQPIETAPKDGTDVIVGFDLASVWIIHLAWFNKDTSSWWSYTRGSVTQEELEGCRTPTHWIPHPPRPVCAR